MCASYSIDESKVKLKKARFVFNLSIFVLPYVCYLYIQRMLANKVVYGYTDTLNGNVDLLISMGKVFAVFLISYGLIYMIFRRGYLSKSVYMIALSCVFFSESFFYADIYVAHASKEWKDINDGYVNSYSLENKIADEHFFRVKLAEDIYSNGNYVGALGYNSLSHYSSMIDRNYVRVMKKLGYGGVWVTICPYGGTLLTDALLSVKYIIDEESENSLKSKSLVIKPLAEFLPLGIILPRESSKVLSDLPELADRTQYQEYFSRAILGENIIKRYLPKSEIENVQGKYFIAKDSVLNYDLHVVGENSLYFDIFDNKIFFDMDLMNSVEVSINGRVLEEGYPKLYRNGLLYIGDFKDEDVKITLHLKKDVKCASFGIFGVDVVKLHGLCSKLRGAELNVKGSGLYGECSAEEDCTLFVSLPYNDNYMVKLNGKKIDYQRALGGFISIDLSKGENEINITFIPKGFILGSIMSILGILLLGVYVKFVTKLEKFTKFDRAVKVIVLIGSSLIFIIVYIVPVVIKIFV